VGKYGTNLEGFGGFEGGVNADKGAPLVSTSSDGETALLFGPAALREIQAGVANGDFAIPPDDATAAISDENPLPYWTLSGDTSIAVTVANDVTAASSNVLQFYNPNVSTDIRVVELQNIARSSSYIVCNSYRDTCVSTQCPIRKRILIADCSSCIIRRNGKVAVCHASLNLAQRSWTEEQRRLAVARCADERCALVGVYAALKAAESF